MSGVYIAYDDLMIMCACCYHGTHSRRTKLKNPGATFALQKIMSPLLNETSTCDQWVTSYSNDYGTSVDETSTRSVTVCDNPDSIQQPKKVET